MPKGKKMIIGEKFFCQYDSCDLACTVGYNCPKIKRFGLISKMNLPEFYKRYVPNQSFNF